MRRPNLRVLTRAHATRVLFEGRRAAGVEYRRARGAPRRAVHARRAVLLAAGAIGSPQLLQLSGVGDPDLLRNLGIDVVAPLPAVGRNLHDHVGVDLVYRARVPTLNDVLRPWSGRLRVGARYLLRRDGPLSLSINQAGGFAKTHPGLDHPDLQLYFWPASYREIPAGRRPLMSPDPFPGFQLGISLCRPASRGDLRIRSADPWTRPAIRANYLAEEQDVRTLLAGVRFLRRFAAADPMAAVIAAEIDPGPAVESDGALVDDIRARASTVFHPVGSCRMGPDPAASVVDARLRAHGVEGLRVIDASVFPSIPSGNTNAPTMMVADRGARMLLSDAG